MIHHNYEIETGIQAFSTFKEKNLLPDAFVCVNDNTAVGVCLAAKEAGYSIPGDFLVTGFDNEDKASYYEPRITTVGFSKADIMENALLMLEKSGMEMQRRLIYTHLSPTFFRKAAAVFPRIHLTVESM